MLAHDASDSKYVHEHVKRQGAIGQVEQHARYVHKIDRIVPLQELLHFKGRLLYMHI